MPLRELPRVERLDLATVQLPRSHPAASLGSPVPVYGYLIHHPDGAIVVDTGVGFGNEFIDDMYRPDRTPLVDALAARDVDARNVVAIVNSHLHFDHCGQNAVFDGERALLYVQRAEIVAAESDPFYTVAAWALGPDENRRILDGDEVIADGVKVLATPGHTRGHQSVVVEAAGDRIVIGAQVVWDLAEFADETVSTANVDPTSDLRTVALESIRRLKSLEPRIVHFSHCRPYQRPNPASF